MHIRDTNIIVCGGCGAERNPEIQFEHDFVKYDAETKIATCSNCGDSGEIVFPGEVNKEPIEP